MNAEELKRAGEVIIAAANGARIQFRKKGLDEWFDLRSDNSTWDWRMFDYRIKPAKTIRPWKPEEVPWFAGFRYKNISHFEVYFPTRITNEVTCAFLDTGITYQDLLEKWEFSTDGGKTWNPCGVEVQS